MLAIRVVRVKVWNKVKRTHVSVFFFSCVCRKGKGGGHSFMSNYISTQEWDIAI